MLTPRTLGTTPCKSSRQTWGLGAQPQPVPDLYVLLQDQPATESAFALCAVPAGVDTLDALMVDSDVAPQAGGRAKGALTKSAWKLFH